jgi:hypothetical protein
MFLCLASTGQNINDQVNTNGTTKLIREIIENEKKVNKCKLSDDEIKNAMSYIFEKNDIALKSFSKAAESGEKIVKGLYMVVDKKQAPSEVYKQLNMQSSNISTEIWDSYVKTYKTPAQIKKLDDMIPRSMDVIINSGKDQLGKLIEDWLLFRKILIIFDKQYPDEKGLSEREKEKKWWHVSLAKYDLKEEQKNIISNMITVSQALSSNDAKHMEIFFKNKLEDSNFQTKK